MKIGKMLEFGLRIAAMGLGFWTIYWLFLKITGHSPTFDEITLALLTGMATVILTLLVKISGEISELKGKFDMHTRHADKRFEALAADFKAHAENSEKRFYGLERKIDTLHSGKRSA